MIQKFVNGCVILLGLTMCAGCSLMPKSNQVKGLQLAGQAVDVAQALDCDHVKAAAAVATMNPQVEAVDCNAVKAALALAQSVIQQKIADLQK